MNKAFKRYSKRKWINTPLANKYKRERALVMSVLCGNQAIATSIVQQIHNHKAETKQQKISKATAIAASIVDANTAAVGVLKRLDRWKV